MFYSYKNRLCCLVIFLCSLTALGAKSQPKIDNKKYFSCFFQSPQKSLLIVGENHSSSVASEIYPELIRYLHRRNGLHTLLIEFGPSEAYFYSEYLKTGKEKYLDYTIYAGYYRDWRKAWRKIYKFNKQLDKPLQIIGIDFDRARTLGYAIYNIFKQYNNLPPFTDSLMSQIRRKKFYHTYTNGYPTKKDKQWTSYTKLLLAKNRIGLKEQLNADDYQVIRQVISNRATDYDKKRERQLTANVIRLIKNSDSQKFFLLAGRDHAYYKPLHGNRMWLAERLRKSASFRLRSGVILFEDSKLWGKNYKKAITLHELKNKSPWKSYYKPLNKRATHDITVVSLDDKLDSLQQYTDYVIVARHQPPINFFKK